MLQTWFPVRLVEDGPSRHVFQYALTVFVVYIKNKKEKEKNSSTDPNGNYPRPIFHFPVPTF